MYIYDDSTKAQGAPTILEIRDIENLLVEVVDGGGGKRSEPFLDGMAPARTPLSGVMRDVKTNK